MKSLLDWIIHMNEISSALDSGQDACFSDSTFFGSGLRPSFVMMTSQNGIWSLLKMHLLGLRGIPYVSMISSTFSSTSSCPLWVFVAIIRSSWIMCACGMKRNSGVSAFANSPDAGHAPMVILPLRISLSPAWNTVMYFDSSSN